MNTDSIKVKFGKPKNRRAFAYKYLGSHIAAQHRALRVSRNLSQEKMADESKFHQPRISKIENPDYDQYTLSSLKEVAEFFDVVPFFEYISFEEFLTRIENETPDDLAPSSFDDCFKTTPQPIAPEPPPLPTTDESAKETRGLEGVFESNERARHDNRLQGADMSATKGSPRADELMAEAGR